MRNIEEKMNLLWLLETNNVKPWISNVNPFGIDSFLGKLEGPHLVVLSFLQKMREEMEGIKYKHSVASGLSSA